MKNKSIEVLSVKNLKKNFILHNQNSIELPVFSNISFSLRKGECLVLVGPSGAGKSTLLRSIYGNYLTTSGEINVYHDQSWINLVETSPNIILDIRKKTLGYVSQFLRVIPRISTLDLVTEPLLGKGDTKANSINQAKDILTKLAVPENLWDLPPATFSGGEQQRVNIAITLVRQFPILLLDEPTASLDAKNKQAVIDLIIHEKKKGTAIIGIFHDENVRDALGTTFFDIEKAKKAA
jgi:alpha-D-ribose 1-methylphosphonate 5-triphosphate synthase subunit PhnL